MVYVVYQFLQYQDCLYYNVFSSYNLLSKGRVSLSFGGKIELMYKFAGVLVVQYAMTLPCAFMHVVLFKWHLGL